MTSGTILKNSENVMFLQPFLCVVENIFNGTRSNFLINWAPRQTIKPLREKGLLGAEKFEKGAGTKKSN